MSLRLHVSHYCSSLFGTGMGPGVDEACFLRRSSLAMIERSMKPVSCERFLEVLW